MLVDKGAIVDLIGCHEVVAPLSRPTYVSLGSPQSVQLVVDFVGLFTACLRDRQLLIEHL